jgi:hypothetical protein
MKDQATDKIAATLDVPAGTKVLAVVNLESAEAKDSAGMTDAALNDKADMVMAEKISKSVMDKAALMDKAARTDKAATREISVLMETKTDTVEVAADLQEDKGVATTKTGKLSVEAVTPKALNLEEVMAVSRMMIKLNIV